MFIFFFESCDDCIKLVSSEKKYSSDGQDLHFFQSRKIGSSLHRVRQPNAVYVARAFSDLVDHHPIEFSAGNFCVIRLSNLGMVKFSVLNIIRDFSSFFFRFSPIS